MGVQPLSGLGHTVPAVTIGGFIDAKKRNAQGRNRS